MKVNWTSRDETCHTAVCMAGAGHGERLLAEVHQRTNARTGCWAWLAWNTAAAGGTHIGVADALHTAKALAELALLSELVSQQKQAA